MNTIITIEDDFDLEKIRLSGQIFRMTKEGDEYCVIHGNHALKISQKSGSKFAVSCSKTEFEQVWQPYFDLNRNYAEIRKSVSGQNSFVDMTLDFGQGLRILHQDSWEMIVTFIISQRRSMPAIATAVDKIARFFGEDCGDFYAFPTAEKFCSLCENDIRECGVGYRAPYILDAASKVASGELSLDVCESLPDEDLFNKLCEIKGVGKKVANCIMLFGFARTARAPVDVWIERVIQQEFAGRNPFPTYGNHAGIIQQYMFYWKTQHRK